jgi:DNA-binding NarL/FixJ family response regulator
MMALVTQRAAIGQAPDLLERDDALAGLGRALAAVTQRRQGQLEVLALLDGGLRNAQIAERLVLSEKTVDHHVSAILGKLGVHSRGQASAEGRRLGLLGVVETFGPSPDPPAGPRAPGPRGMNTNNPGGPS